MFISFRVFQSELEVGMRNYFIITGLLYKQKFAKIKLWNNHKKKHVFSPSSIAPLNHFLHQKRKRMIRGKADVIVPSKLVKISG